MMHPVISTECFYANADEDCVKMFFLKSRKVESRRSLST